MIKTEREWFLKSKNQIFMDWFHFFAKTEQNKTMLAPNFLTSIKDGVYKEKLHNMTIVGENKSCLLSKMKYMSQLNIDILQNPMARNHG